MSENSLELSEADLNNLYGTPTGPFVHRHSSLAYAIGLTVLLRERFAEGQGTVWKSQARRETGWVPDQSNASLYVMNAYDEEPEMDNLFPRIVIQHGQTQYMEYILGNETTENSSRLRRGFKVHSIMGETAFGLDVVALNRGECAILAELAAFSIMACSDILKRMIKVRKVKPPSMSAPAPMIGPGSARAWRSQIAFSLEFETVWSTVPIAPELKAVELNAELGDKMAEATRTLTQRTIIT